MQRNTFYRATRFCGEQVPILQSKSATATRRSQRRLRNVTRALASRRATRDVSNQTCVPLGVPNNGLRSNASTDGFVVRLRLPVPLTRNQRSSATQTPP